jgi:hypothetical protein
MRLRWAMVDDVLDADRLEELMLMFCCKPSGPAKTARTP